MTANELEEWVNQGRLDEIPFMADAAEGDVSDPWNLELGLAEGLRACQAEGRRPARLTKVCRFWPGGSTGVSYLTDSAKVKKLKELLSAHGGTTQVVWGWRIDKSLYLDHRAAKVDRVRARYLAGKWTRPASAPWKAYPTPVAAVARFGWVSAAFGWPEKRLVVARSLFRVNFGVPASYHAVVQPDGDPGKYNNRPALCGRRLSGLSHWEWHPRQDVGCEDCRERLGTMLRAHSLTGVAPRAAAG